MRADFLIFCSEVFATMNTKILIIISIVQNQALIGTAVRWQRETNPVYFGNNVTLTCMVGRKEGCNNTVTRRWDAGPDRNILLLNGHSTNSSKYYEISEEPCENFSLVIMKFDQKDVNWEYWCSFGFETSRQMLMLDDRHFIGVPEKKDIQFSLEQRVQISLDLKITFFKVYPNPKCKIKIGNGDWVDEALVLTPVGIRFKAILHYNTTIGKSQCNNTITTICSLLSYTILQFNERLNCTDADENTTTHLPRSLIYSIIGIIVIIVVFLILLVVKQKGKHILSDIFIFGCSELGRKEIRWNKNRDLDHPDDAVGIN